VRRLFALNQIYDPWRALTEPVDANPGGRHSSQRSVQQRNVFATATPDRPVFAERIVPTAKAIAPTPYGTLLSDVTIYTSLESCAQCSGIMCLASVKQIVYLQRDQGQFLIGNMMWQATNAEREGFLAPRPVCGSDFGFVYFDRLNEANDRFAEAVGASPFYRSADFIDDKPGVTSFLCTDEAHEILRAADRELADLETLSAPSFRPRDSAMSNSQVLAQAHDFLDWVSAIDNRGAAHRV
jgi:hypothetical protein